MIPSGLGIEPMINGSMSDLMLKLFMIMVLQESPWFFKNPHGSSRIPMVLQEFPGNPKDKFNQYYMYKDV